MITAAVRCATGYAYNAAFAQDAMTDRNAEAHRNILENIFSCLDKAGDTAAIIERLG